jgi:hypothetical protein
LGLIWLYSLVGLTALAFTANVLATSTQDENDNPTITIWYGSHQIFGHFGHPQRWVNILGTVASRDTIASLTYSLNDGPNLPLSIGPDRTRLLAAGDFNIEIACKDLSDGLNEVKISATDKLGRSTEVGVTVEYKSGNVWPDNYSIDWDKVSNISEAAQIVDGLWKLEAGSVRPVNAGYDRLIAIGDTTWNDFEVTVPITIHRFLTGGALVGLLMRWRGHDDGQGQLPRTQWWPMGALVTL